MGNTSSQLQPSSQHAARQRSQDVFGKGTPSEGVSDAHRAVDDPPQVPTPKTSQSVKTNSNVMTKHKHTPSGISHQARPMTPVKDVDMDMDAPNSQLRHEMLLSQQRREAKPQVELGHTSTREHKPADFTGDMTATPTKSKHDKSRKRKHDRDQDEAANGAKKQRHKEQEPAHPEGERTAEVAIESSRSAKRKRRRDRRKSQINDSVVAGTHTQIAPEAPSALAISDETERKSRNHNAASAVVDEELALGTLPAPEISLKKKKKKKKDRENRNNDDLAIESKADVVAKSEPAAEGSDKKRTRKRKRHNKDHADHAQGERGAGEIAKAPESSQKEKRTTKIEYDAIASRQEGITNEASVLPRSAPSKKRKHKTKVEADELPTATKQADPLPRTSDESLPSSGPFVKPEIDFISSTIDDLRDVHSIDETTFNDWVQEGSRRYPAIKGLYADLLEGLPHRDRKSIVRFCQRKYHNFQRGAWTAEADQELRDAHQETPNVWSKIAVHLGRTAEDCRDRWRNHVQYQPNQRNTEAWKPAEEDELLKAIDTCVMRMKESGVLSQDVGRDTIPEDVIQWKVVSQLMGGRRNRLQCAYKWKKLKYRWQRESQDQLGLLNNRQKSVLERGKQTVKSNEKAMEDHEIKIEESDDGDQASRQSSALSESSLERDSAAAELQRAPLDAVGEELLPQIPAHDLKDHIRRVRLDFLKNDWALPGNDLSEFDKFDLGDNYAMLREMYAVFKDTDFGTFSTSQYREALSARFDNPHWNNHDRAGSLELMISVNDEVRNGDYTFAQKLRKSIRFMEDIFSEDVLEWSLQGRRVYHFSTQHPPVEPTQVTTPPSTPGSEWLGAWETSGGSSIASTPLDGVHWPLGGSAGAAAFEAAREHVAGQARPDVPYEVENAPEGYSSVSDFTSEARSEDGHSGSTALRDQSRSAPPAPTLALASTTAVERERTPSPKPIARAAASCTAGERMVPLMTQRRHRDYEEDGRTFMSDTENIHPNRKWVETLHRKLQCVLDERQSKENLGTRSNVPTTATQQSVHYIVDFDDADEPSEIEDADLDDVEAVDEVDHAMDGGDELSDVDEQVDVPQSSIGVGSKLGVQHGRGPDNNGSLQYANAAYGHNVGRSYSHLKNERGVVSQSDHHLQSSSMVPNTQMMDEHTQQRPEHSFGCTQDTATGRRSDSRKSGITSHMSQNRPEAVVPDSEYEDDSERAGVKYAGRSVRRSEGRYGSSRSRIEEAEEQDSDDLGSIDDY